MSQDQVAEIVTFRLKDGADAHAFVEAAKGMEPFLQSTGAMLDRVLSCSEDGVWTDHLRWTSMAAAKAAAEQMMMRPEAGPFVALIDENSMTMRHAPVRMQQG